MASPEIVPNVVLIQQFLRATAGMSSASEVERLTGISADSVTRFRNGESRQISAGMRAKLEEYLRRPSRVSEPAPTYAEGVRWGYVTAAREFIGQGMAMLDRALGAAELAPQPTIPPKQPLPKEDFEETAAAPKTARSSGAKGGRRHGRR